MSHGRYFEFNFSGGITASFDSLMQHLNWLLNATFESREVVVKMEIECDGMPASKSTNSQLWPIPGLLLFEGALSHLR